MKTIEETTKKPIADHEWETENRGFSHNPKEETQENAYWKEYPGKYSAVWETYN